MLSDGRMPLSDAESASVDKLISDHADGGKVHLTRRDPGETGPLLVHIGDDIYTVKEDGKTRKQAG